MRPAQVGWAVSSSTRTTRKVRVRARAGGATRRRPWRRGMPLGCVVLAFAAPVLSVHRRPMATVRAQRPTGTVFGRLGGGSTQSWAGGAWRVWPVACDQRYHQRHGHRSGGDRHRRSLQHCVGRIRAHGGGCQRAEHLYPHGLCVGLSGLGHGIGADTLKLRKRVLFTATGRNKTRFLFATGRTCDQAKLAAW